jgi:hypothetical protein
MTSRARPIVVIAVFLTLLTSAGAAPLAVSAQGNSASALACQNGGWQWLAREDGSTFRNTGDCVSYGARGGTHYASSHVEFRFTNVDGQRCWLEWTLVDGRPGDVVHVDTVLLSTTWKTTSTVSATLTFDAPQAPRDERVTWESVYDSSTAYIEASGLPVRVENVGSAQCNR